MSFTAFVLVAVAHAWYHLNVCIYTYHYCGARLLCLLCLYYVGMEKEDQDWYSSCSFFSSFWLFFWLILLIALHFFQCKNKRIKMKYFPIRRPILRRKGGLRTPPTWCPKEKHTSSPPDDISKRSKRYNQWNNLTAWRNPREW